MISAFRFKTEEIMGNWKSCLGFSHFSHCLEIVHHVLLCDSADGTLVKLTEEMIQLTLAIFSGFPKKNVQLALCEDF